MEPMRADPIFRDVTSDAQLKGLQAQLNIDRDKANALGVNDPGHPHRALQRLRRAPGLDHLHRGRLLPGDPAGGARRQQDESAFAKIFVRGERARWCRSRASRPSSARSGPIAINHAGQLQAITVSFNLAPGAALGDATAKIEEYRDQIRLPASILTS